MSGSQPVASHARPVSAARLADARPAIGTLRAAQPRRLPASRPWLRAGLALRPVPAAAHARRDRPFTPLLRRRTPGSLPPRALAPAAANTRRNPGRNTRRLLLRSRARQAPALAQPGATHHLPGSPVGQAGAARGQIAVHKPRLLRIHAARASSGPLFARTPAAPTAPSCALPRDCRARSLRARAPLPSGAAAGPIAAGPPLHTARLPAAAPPPRAPVPPAVHRPPPPAAHAPATVGRAPPPHAAICTSASRAASGRACARARVHAAPPATVGRAPPPPAVHAPAPPAAAPGRRHPGH